MTSFSTNDSVTKLINDNATAKSSVIIIVQFRIAFVLKLICLVSVYEFIMILH